MPHKNLDSQSLSMKVLKGPKQIEREKTETIWDRFDRLQRRLALLRKGKKKSRKEFIVSEELTLRDPDQADLLKI